MAAIGAGDTLADGHRPKLFGPGGGLRESSTRVGLVASEDGVVIQRGRKAVPQVAFETPGVALSGKSPSIRLSTISTPLTSSSVTSWSVALESR